MTIDLHSRALEAWKWWRVWIHDFVTAAEGSRESHPCHFNDLVLTAVSRLPSRLLGHDLAKVSNFAWSELALAGIASQFLSGPRSVSRDMIPPTSEYVPLWAPIAALRVLGFGRDILKPVLVAPRMSTRTTSEDDMAFAEIYLSEIGDSGSGVIALSQRDRELEEPHMRPYLVISPVMLAEYEGCVRWLKETGVIWTILDDAG